jgi:hypothetical protein
VGGLALLIFDLAFRHLGRALDVITLRGAAIRSAARWTTAICAAAAAGAAAAHGAGPAAGAAVGHGAVVVVARLAASTAAGGECQ